MEDNSIEISLSANEAIGRFFNLSLVNGKLPQQSMWKLRVFKTLVSICNFLIAKLGLILILKRALYWAVLKNLFSIYLPANMIKTRIC